MKRRIKEEVKEFPIYSKQEANEEGLPYKAWRECNAGQWGLSDDAYVSECLKRQGHRNKDGKVNTVLPFPFARVWERRNQELKWGPQKESGKFFDTSEKTWQEREAGKTLTRNVVTLYVQQLLAGKIDYEMLGRAYRPDQKIPAATARRLFRHAKIQELICQELEAVLKRYCKGKRSKSTCSGECVSVASGQVVAPYNQATCSSSQVPIKLQVLRQYEGT